MTSWQVDAGGSVDPEDVRRAADEILSRAEYREPQPTLADRALDAIGDLLGRAVGVLTGGGAGSVIGTVVVIGLLALAGWVLARALGRPGGRMAGGGPGGAVHGTTAASDPAVWAAEAERLADAGDHRGALRCRHQELVAHLVRGRVLPDRPARTPAELRADLGEVRADLDGPMAELTDRFEAVWYGGAPSDRAGYERFRDLAATVRGLARQAPAEAR